MRPDLFAGGPALRDDSYRILARLANGGGMPAPARNWMQMAPVVRSRIAVVATLLLAAAAAFTWLQGEESLPPRQPEATAHVAAPLPPVQPPTPQAAAIINVPVQHPELAAAAPPAVAPAAQPEPRAVRPRAAKPAAARPQRNIPTAESDEDVTLLAAMLKHANPQKPAASSPKE